LVGVLAAGFTAAPAVEVVAARPAATPPSETAAQAAPTISFRVWFMRIASFLGTDQVA
jgi:hypothetical protein